MNDALMQKKSRHTNTQRYLTDYVRRALLLLLLVVVSGGAWGQIATIKKGLIDEDHVGDYSTIKSKYTETVSVPDIRYDSSWSEYTGSNGSGQHWDGSSTYFDCWNGSRLTPSTHHKSITMSLPKGRYTLLTPARGGTGVNVTMTVNDDRNHETSITMIGRGDTGKGITTAGVASFDDGTFANNNEGHGWEYFYIQFDVETSNTDVHIDIKGQSNGVGWMSASTPYLLKAPDNGITAVEPFETDLTKNMYNNQSDCGYTIGTSTDLPYGDGSVHANNYADLTNYSSLVLTVSAGEPRLLFNRQTDDDNAKDYLEISPNVNWSKYVTVDGDKRIINLEEVANDRNLGYVHLNCIKEAVWQNKVTVTSAKLTGPSLRSLYQNGDADFVWKVDEQVAAGQVIFGDNSGGVPSDQYVDLSTYDKLVLTYDNTKGLPRFIFNKDADDKSVIVESAGDYMTVDGDKITIHLAKLASDNGGIVHLNAIKAPWGNSSIIKSASIENITPETITKTIAVGGDNIIQLDGNLLCDHIPYNYIRIELVHGDNSGLTPAYNGQDMTQSVSVPTFRIESQNGDKQQSYTNVGNNIWADALLGGDADILVSSGSFTFKIPNDNRTSYMGNHLKIYLGRYSDNTHGVYNPPTIERTYDYTLWLAGNEPTSQEAIHQLYQANEGLSSFQVDLYNLSLTQNEANILSHFNKTQFSEFDNFYLRWYIADNKTHLPIADENGTPISQYYALSETTGYNLQKYHEDVGMLWYLKNGWGEPALNTSTEMGTHAQEVLKVNVTLPNGLTQDDVEIVALITDDYTNAGVGAEPTNLKHKYVVNFTNALEEYYKNLPFHHYKGVTGRDWVSYGDNIATQYAWKPKAGYNNLLPTTESNDPNVGDENSVETISDANIRQGVHTWEYNVYFSPSDGQRALLLPFEHYMYGYGDNTDGNDLEPRAYFRWYDWKTDLAVDGDDYTMTAVNPDTLKMFRETVNNQTRDRGLIALSLNPYHPTHKRVGVWFQVTNDFTKEKYPNGIDIACDVSKYSDGIVTFGSNSYLEHEPTLSMRYIFHIFPASLIADTLSKARANLSKARVKLENPNLTPQQRLDLYTRLEYYGIPDENIKPMFHLPEDRGRMVVSLGEDKKGSFSLRLDEHALVNYKMWDVNNSNTLVNADHVKWVAFYENEETGQVMRKELATPNTSFIQTFTYNDFKGNYYPLGWETGDDMITVNDGMRFHVVGYVTSGDVNTLEGTGTFAPVAHYELQFLVAPPIPVISLRDNVNNLRADNITRTDEYLKQNYDLKAVVDFDGNPETNSNIKKEPERKHYFYSSLDENNVIDDSKSWDATPNTRANNMSWLPREWTDIEYSYCYPQLCNYVINTNPGNSYWQYNHFLSPFHGDYMILESMNMPGVSTQRTEPYQLQFWDGGDLRDYTSVMSYGAKSGSFLYTDASNESRTMITIPFDADLCGGSSIYFTAAVADKTDASIKPQLLVRIVGVDEEGNHVRVVSFHTCDINTTKADGDDIHQWFQVYGESTIPATFNDEIDHFICEVVNYADNTNGADFAIDHFQIYTNTAKVKINQEYGECDNPETNKMFIYADAEGIQALYGKTGTAKIYWRIHDEHGEVVKAPKMYQDDDLNGDSIYAMTEIPLDYITYFNNHGSVDSAAVKANPALSWFMGDDHKVYCKIAYRYLPGLEDGQTYYVSIYDPARERSDIGFRPEVNAYWGGLNTAARSKCSVFSPFFIPQQQFVIYYTEGAGGAEGGHIKMNCGEAPIVTDMKMKLKKPDITQASGFTDVTGLHFDYFFGTIQQWNSNTETFTYNNTQYAFSDLKTAYLRYRRNEDVAYHTHVGVPDNYTDTYDNKDMAAILRAAVAADLLELDCKETFSNNFNTRPAKNYTVVCLPIEETIPNTDPVIYICSPFLVKFDIVWPSPEMELGFPDVEYPQREGMHRVVRIGLEQLYNLRTQSYQLHIPIHDYKDNTKEANTGTLYFEKGDSLCVSATTDPTLNLSNPDVPKRLAMLLTPHSSSYEGKTFVDADHMFLVLDFSGDNCKINFHEGYSYEVHTRFYDKSDDDAHITPCYEDLFLTFKIVPEYVTWDPRQLETTDNKTWYNVNWNNDKNWNRSERIELYMDEMNTPTEWRANLTDGATYYGDKYYKNAVDVNENLKSDSAFVPMKFTYVTLPEECRAPSLINMELLAYNTSPYTGGALLAGNLITDPSPYDPTRTVNSPATQDIVYDLLVRYSEKTCQGHLQSDKTTVYQLGTGSTYANVYDCEKFYGNICKEIYFKPRAELICQQRLTYEKAWVEKELEPNKWYLMSAPLKATYAGDMYVPKADGRQTTEAFQPITFNTTSYSRTTYPFYQHSWDHGTGGSTVYVQISDPIHPNNYIADLPYTEAVTQTFAQWSHAFNDVQVRYDQMQGFAIHTKQDKTKTGNALLRLPKADPSWDYYNYKDVHTNDDLTQSGPKGNMNYGRFLTDDDEGNPINNRAEMTKPLVQPNTNTNNKYYLVGNPYMASLNMTKFFEANTHLEKEWWAINGDPAAGEATGRVRPMEAFFVKIKEGSSSATPVNFNKDMMVDGNDGTVQSGSRRPRLQLKATKDGVTSTAIVELNDSATNDFVDSEDVETLFDSNLADVPMVYTVASDGMALSINQLPEIVTVPFGVTCSSDEQVEVTVDLSPLTTNHSPFTLHPSPIFVFDAQTGITRAISDGETISIQPNDYGRYYLTTNDKIGRKEQNADNDVVISVRQGGVVTVSAQGQLSLVRAVSVGGATAYEQTDCGTITEFRLQQGTYVIETAGDAGRRTIKIQVR